MLVGCVPQMVVRDHEAACRVARDMAGRASSAAELVELTAPFPRANVYALRAYQARIATMTLTALGAAGIAGAFIAGFAVDRSKPEVRTGLYADVGATIGLGVAALVSGYVWSSSSRKAVTQLDADTRAECGPP